MQDLLRTLPQSGKVEWIGIRPEKKAPLTEVEAVKATTENGLEGDHYHGKSGNRQVTLIQAEHLEGVARMLGKAAVAPQLTRRNIVVSGINLLALHNTRFRIGSAVLQGTGYCHPCSRMEENLGAGGYNAMRGHGGVTARVIEGGDISRGDEVRMVEVVEA